MTYKDDIVARLTVEARRIEGGDDVYTDEGDQVASLRDYLDNTFDYESFERSGRLTSHELYGEIAAAFIAGMEHQKGDPCRAAWAAVNKARLTL